MTVRIVTDSCSDITQEEARRLGITVVPAYVRFGDRVYRDGVDIDADAFYLRVACGGAHPYTSAPSPGDFADAYSDLARETREIVSIHITARHSVTYNAALLGSEIARKDNRGLHIEVIDSRGVTMWEGLAAIAANRLARDGRSLREVVDGTHETIGRLRGLALLNTLASAVRGGRLAKTIAAVESVIPVKSLLTVKDGEIRSAGLARTRGAGIERLRELVRRTEHPEGMAVAYATDAQEAEDLAAYARARHPEVDLRMARLGPTLGSHAGSGALMVALVAGNIAEPGRRRA